MSYLAKESMTDDERLELRFENWGRWMREGHQVGKTTSTYFDLTPLEACEDDEPPPPPINLRDALLVNAAWSRLPTCSERYRLARSLIAQLYAESGREFDFYRSILFRLYRLRLRQRDFDELRLTARQMMANIIQRLDMSRRGV